MTDRQMKADTQNGRADKGASASGQGRDSAVMAVSEVVLVFLLFWLWIKYLETTWVGTVQLVLVGWDFFAHLMMVVFPLVIIVLGRRPLSDLGMARQDLRDPEVRRISRVAVAELSVIWTVALLVPNLIQGRRPHLILPPRHFAEYLELPVRMTKYIGWGVTVVFTMVFCGLGEEIFFRGYMQGRINNTMGRPFKLMGVSFGWGIIVASVLFGIGHGIGYYNPFVDGVISFEWGPALVTLVEGFILGLLYERTGNIIASVAVHAFIGLFFGAVVFPG